MPLSMREETKLPAANDSSLIVTHPTASERRKIWAETASSWGRALSQSTYISREIHRMNSALERDGGITHWILVLAEAPPDDRVIYASSETVRKRVFVARGTTIEDAVTHCVGSVWCSPHLRGNGYASRMMCDMEKSLAHWQEDQGTVASSVLFSDIGRTYYGRWGWKPYESRHVEFPAAAVDGSLARPMSAKDVEQFCQDDVASLRLQLTKDPTATTRMAIVPDWQLMSWFLDREDFVTNSVFGSKPSIRGAVAGEVGSRVSAIFYRSYSAPVGLSSSHNTLYVIRLAIEGETTSEALQANFNAIIACAQSEANAWKAVKVDLWNPSPLVQELVAGSNVEHSRVEREQDSIPCLRWYAQEGEDVDWVALEKYCWF